LPAFRTSFDARSCPLTTIVVVTFSARIAIG
jgi:hypothetical protein